MLGVFGTYDVVVAGAGVTGVISTIAAAREGAKTLLVEGSGVIGGLITGGRMSKPTGPVEGGIFREMIDRVERMGGADSSTKASYWGPFTSIFDPEVMQRVILELLEESGAEILLHARIDDAILEGQTVRGIGIHVKSGHKLVLAKATVDATGDGDVAALAGAEFALGRPSDGLTQPITSYVRVINVDVVRLAQYMRTHRDDFTDLVLPDEQAMPDAYAFGLFATGFTKVIERARAEGFSWIIPKNHITIKTGLLPGEININATRVHGNALDERVLSEAEITIRKQAYCVYDFLRRYVAGFEKALFLDVGSKIGVRETRRILGEYVLTEADVRSEARFPDSIGVSKCAIDIHEPGGEKGLMVGVGAGYDIPLRCLLPKGRNQLLVAGRCISADHVAHGSTRNTPACAITGQAAGTASAMSARTGTPVRALDIGVLQARLKKAGIPIR
ncbi:MAG TPA: FAD-dependent oxidoreductase [Candidatus Methylomirabilis sp.]|nr:FAD-dependent oxidoreductase [Candidatus Methylomirabilis sp.]